jgi:hypothetical protein
MLISKRRPFISKKNHAGDDWTGIRYCYAQEDIPISNEILLRGSAFSGGAACSGWVQLNPIICC